MSTTGTGADAQEGATRDAEDGGSAHWRRMKSIFATAIALEQDARHAHVAEACEGNEELRREVEALLAAYEPSAHFLHVPVMGELGMLADFDRADESPDRHLGPYRILRQIGRGGTSIVYLAERADEEFQHQVAIKLLRRDMNSSEMRRRFRAERQILANLRHPSGPHGASRGRRRVR